MINKKPEFNFMSYKDFHKHIDKSDYNPEKILNKIAKITEKEFDHFLNVLPPMNWYNEEELNYYYLMECLTENIYLKFVRIKIGEEFIYYCCCERVKNVEDDYFL